MVKQFPGDDKMKLFTIIEAGFLMASLLIFYYIIEPISAGQPFVIYGLLAIYLILGLNLLKWIKKRFNVEKRKIDTQLGVMLLIGIFLGPLFIDLFLFGIGK